MFSAAETVVVLKTHPVGKVPVSDLCDQYQIRVDTVCRRPKVFRDDGTAACEATPSPKPRPPRTHDG